MLIVLGSKGGGLFDCLMSTRIFTLVNAQDIHMSSNTYEVNGFEHDLDFILIPHKWLVSFISYKRIIHLYQNAH